MTPCWHVHSGEVCFHAGLDCLGHILLIGFGFNACVCDFDALLLHCCRHARRLDHGLDCRNHASLIIRGTPRHYSGESMCACEATDKATAKQVKSGRDKRVNGRALATFWRKSASALIHARESVLDNAKAKLLQSRSERFAQGRAGAVEPRHTSCSSSKRYAKYRGVPVGMRMSSSYYTVLARVP